MLSFIYEKNNLEKGGINMYYHLNPEFNKTFPTLKPFIPKYLLEDRNQETNTLENRTIPRVCVSSDISKAFFALTWTTFFLETLVSDRYLLYTEGFMDARTEEIGLPMRVYVVEDEPDFSNEDILSNNFVFDAKETKEAWFLNEVKPTGSFVFFVKGSFEKDNERFIDGYVIDQDEMLFLVNPMDYFLFVEDNFALEGMSLEEKLNAFLLDEKALFNSACSKSSDEKQYSQPHSSNYDDFVCYNKTKCDGPF